MSSKSTTKLRFTIFEDLLLLREILGHNPFEDNSKWIDVQKNVNAASSKNFSLRTIKEHCDHLLKLFKKNDRANLRKSGTEEQYDEKEQLLQQIADLERDFGKKKKTPKPSCSTSTNQGIQQRDEAAQKHFVVRYDIESEDDEVERVHNTAEEEVNIQLIQENSIPELATNNTEEQHSVPQTNLRKHKSKTLKNNALEYLKERKKSENKIKEKELELEERKIAIEERRLIKEEKKISLQEAQFEIEKEERIKRLKLEIEERTHKIELEKQLSEINSILVKHVLNKSKQ